MQLENTTLRAVACRRTLEWGVRQHKFTDRLLNVPELPTHDNRLPTSNDHIASFYRQAIALPTALVNVRGVTPPIPTSARPLLQVPLRIK